MRNPTFTVIVPTYERPGLLAKTLDSILAQTFEDFECLVVDDASPNPAVVPDDPRVRLLRMDENGGEPVARNAGLAAARGRYVTFVDDDDLYTPDRLAIAIEALGRAPVAVCFRRGLDGSTGGNRVLEGLVHDTILDLMTPQMGQVAIQRDLAPPFNESFAALTDVEWLLRVSSQSPFATVSRVGLLYRKHEGPRNRNGIAERVRCSHMLLEEHADYFSAHPRAAAFRWKRIGLMNQRLGNYSAARAAFVRSLRLRLETATVAHLARSLRRTTWIDNAPRPPERRAVQRTAEVEDG